MLTFHQPKFYKNMKLCHSKWVGSSDTKNKQKPTHLLMPPWHATVNLVRKQSFGFLATGRLNRSCVPFCEKGLWIEPSCVSWVTEFTICHSDFTFVKNLLFLYTKVNKLYWTELTLTRIYTYVHMPSWTHRFPLASSNFSIIITIFITYLCGSHHI